MICMEYNKTKHNDEVFSYLDSKVQPKQFNGPILWQQSAKTLCALIKDYEYCFNNWKLSGNHSAFGEVDESKPELPFANFINNNQSLLYLHDHAYLHPNIMDTLIGDLPSGAFCDPFGSSDGLKNDETVTVSAKKERTTKLVRIRNFLNFLKAVR